MSPGYKIHGYKVIPPLWANFSDKPVDLIFGTGLFPIVIYSLVLRNFMQSRACSFFLLSGVADLMVHYGVHGLPDQLDYAAALLALSVEGFLFRWHQHGHSPIESMVHTYLVYAVGLCVVSGALEMMRPTDVRPSLARAAFLMLQGRVLYLYVS